MPAKADIDEHLEVQVARLFAGREPSAAQLARCATLSPWSAHVNSISDGSRRIVIDGTLTSNRFRIKNQMPMPIVVLWMDRHRQFVVTTAGLWNLGQQESEVGMDFVVAGGKQGDE